MKGRLLYAAAFVLPVAANAQVVDQARAQELVRLVRQDCGSCHGLTLAGGLGPALTAAALAGRPIEALAATILSGRPGSAMPGWSRFMSEDEARWIAGALLRGFPHEAAR